MSVLTMPNNVNGWGKKAGSVTAILVLFTLLGSWVSSLIPSYALSSELDTHISEAGARIKFNLEDKILIIEDELEIYEALKVESPLSVRDRIKEKQLTNRKERYLRQLNNTKPR